MTSTNGIRRLRAVAASALLAALVLAGCAATDVVGKTAATSFKAMAAASAARVAYSEEDKAWTLASPAGDMLALSTDFSRKPEAGTGGAMGSALMDSPDIELEFELAPLVAAGLDPARLPAPAADAAVAYLVEGGTFMVHAELGDEAFAAGARDSIDATFAEILRAHRPAIGWHEALGHYGIKLGGGVMFEWAKDLAKNDKDIVFVLDPAPLLAAGLDPARLGGGWVLAPVEMMDEKGAKVLVDKLLKPFDLR